MASWWTVVGWAFVGGVAGALLSTVTRTFLTTSRNPSRLASRSTGAAVTVLLFAALAWRIGGLVDLVAYSYLAAVGVSLAVIDAIEQRLPSKLLWPSYGVLAALFGLAAVAQANGSDALRALVGMACLAAFYLVLAVLSRGGLGAGDVKLGGVLGLAMGWQSWSTILIGTILGWSLAALVRLALRLSGRRRRDSTMPLGPFLLVGAFAAILASVG
jgi:leader peptidase (prepilin peptidase) / N-methyltransferase